MKRQLTPDEVKIIRSDLGITQLDLARLCNVRSETVHRWERWGCTGAACALLQLIRGKADVPGEKP